MESSKTSITKSSEKAAKGKRSASTTSRSESNSSRTAGSSKKPSELEGKKEAVVKAPPQEAVSLIEPKKKVPRAPDKERAARKAQAILPPISKLAAAKKSAKSAVSVSSEEEVVAEAVSEPVLAEEKPVEPAASPVASEEPEAVAEGTSQAPELADEKVIHIKPPIIVKELAVQLGLKPFQVIADLMELNIFAAINQAIEPEAAAKICDKHGFVFEREKRKHGEGVHKPEPVVVPPPPPPPVVEKKKELTIRAPIITFMGHVDHGKTSLLDAIRKTRVAAGETGGITQHIGAYSVEHQGAKITFLDTPGHAAFTQMRARGANVTDIVVLVVAADDGLMPQTIEALNHAKAASVTIMVAINKVDLPSANVDRVKRQLQEHGLVPEEWGGDVVVCEVSATKGTGISHLLDMLMLQAELLELKADSHVDSRCIVIEAQVEPGRGPTATVIVRMGTLRVGAPFICGNHFGKIKQLIDDLGRPVKSAGPSTPVKVLGFSGLPEAGDELVVMESERAARILGEERLEKIRTKKLAAPARATLESLFKNLGEGQKKTLQIVLKADTQGSLEAISTSLRDIKSDKISLEILHGAVGPVTESDVLLSSASNAVIVGFGVKVESSAATTAKREGIQIKLYSIIYELIDQVKEAMAGLLDPELRETVIGHAEVRTVFDLSRGKVAGCLVKDGRIARTARARVMRGRQPIYDGGIATLRRFQDDVKEVRAGLECGIKLGDFSEYESGDMIECYTLEKIAQQL